MRKNFKVILDCDDVLYQCNQIGVEAVNERNGTTFNMSDIDRWGLLNNPLDQRLDLFADPDFVARQPLYPGAKEFVSELSKRGEIFIATNVPAQCAGARINAIVRDFPQIPVSNILIGGRKDILRADMMLDDAPQYMEGANVRYPVLYRQPWNYGITGMLSVSTLQEFITLVEVIRESESGIKSPPKAIVLVGPTGSGKKELAEKLCALSRLPITRVFSYSTNNAPDYHYISKNDFEAMRTAFFETSSYMGHLFGTKIEDVERVIQEGGIPLLIMDINGMIAMKTHFPTLAVFVKSSKDRCVRDIAQRLLNGLPIDEAVNRISSIDTELRNEDFCDMTVTCNCVEEILDALE